MPCNSALAKTVFRWAKMKVSKEVNKKKSDFPRFPTGKFQFPANFPIAKFHGEIANPSKEEGIKEHMILRSVAMHQH